MNLQFNLHKRYQPVEFDNKQAVYSLATLFRLIFTISLPGT